MPPSSHSAISSSTEQLSSSRVLMTRPESPNRGKSVLSPSMSSTKTVISEQSPYTTMKETSQVTGMVIFVLASQLNLLQEPVKITAEIIQHIFYKGEQFTLYLSEWNIYGKNPCMLFFSINIFVHPALSRIDIMFTESGDTIRKETVIERTFTSSSSANSTSKSASAATANSNIHSGSSSGPNSSSLSNFDYFGESHVCFFSELLSYVLACIGSEVTIISISCRLSWGRQLFVHSYSSILLTCL